MLNVLMNRINTASRSKRNFFSTADRLSGGCVSTMDSNIALSCLQGHRRPSRHSSISIVCIYLLTFLMFWQQSSDGQLPFANSHPRWNEFPSLLQDGCLPQILANVDLKRSYRWTSAVIKLHHSINWPKDKAKKHFSALWCTNGPFTCALL